VRGSRWSGSEAGQRDGASERGGERATAQAGREAGLTVSAYLRSCTFEAEALRAQVKEALAELRTGDRSRFRPPWSR